MNKNVIIAGSGGHGKIVADIVLKNKDIVAGFLDDSGKSPAGFDYLGKIEDYKKYGGCSFIIAVGNNALRKELSERMKGAQWYTAIHPCASVSEIDVTIGQGTVIGAYAVVGPGAVIGKHSIINTAADVEHDCKVGDFTHISPNGTLCGTVCVGSFCHIGAGAVIINNISVCSGVTLGAGGVLVKSISEKGTYAGVPAEKLK